ncbi:MAG: DEAD/DEAH box helicase [Balneolaceae bacterium]|nr:MAG: DEAD/DEAH box helicase [Balneolaceae bacterium]
MGFEKPTPIQEACIPLIMEGRDVLASAQTGTGKTAAFAIPILHNLLEKKKNKQEGIRALVITPTRELASQVDEAFFAIGYHTGLTTAKVYGGDDWSRQEKALNRGTNIIVATPGRLLDHIRIHDIDFSNLDFLILDEADRMLDMGFIPDITQIVSKLPKERQTLLFSATIPPKIEQLARKMMNNPERVNMAPPNMAAEGVTQGMYYVEERDKLPLVLHLYEKEQWNSAIIFMSTKRAVDKLTRELRKKGANVTSIHGDRTQTERERALESFRKGEFRIIVATDVMSRGIDVEGISHIINFSVPHDVEDYVHRIGRTARADAKGDAITLVSGQDRRYMENIIRAMKSKINKLEVPVSKGDEKSDGRKKQEKDKGREQKAPSRQKKDSQDTEKRDSRKQSAEKPDSDKPVPEKPETDQQQDERPKRRRGRKRPGGRKRTGQRQDQDQESRADEQQPSGKQAQDTSAADKQDRGKAVRDDKAADKKPDDKGLEQKDDSGQKRDSRQQKSGGRGRSRGRKPQQRRDEKTGGEDDSRRQGKSGQRKGPRGGRGRGKGPSGQPSGASKKEMSRKETERRELFDNITSPDMKKVNKAVDKKKGFWSKVKNILGGD